MADWPAASYSSLCVKIARLPRWEKPVFRSCLFIALTCLFVASVSAEDTFRCGSKIVRVGMTSAEVLKYCGQPTSKEVEEQDVRSGGRVVGKTQVNRWTYSRGSVGKPKVLEFDQDKLLSIK